MSKPVEGNRPGPSAMRAFDSVPKLLRVRTVDEFHALPEMQQRLTINSHIRASIHYFAGDTDPYLRQLGQLAEPLMVPPGERDSQQPLVAVTTTEMMRSFLEYSQIPQDAIDQIPVDRSTVLAFFDFTDSNPEVDQRITFVIAPALLTSAISPTSTRIDALGQMAYCLSRVQSYMSGAVYQNPELMEERARATEAHFYNRVRLEPGVELSDAAREIAEKHLHGIFSLPLESRPPGYDTIDKRIV